MCCYTLIKFKVDQTLLEVVTSISNKSTNPESEIVAE